MTDVVELPAVVRPWDTAGLPPRPQKERCVNHKWCAYRDDDPAYCPKCHASHVSKKCTCGVRLDMMEELDD
jgi:hypothetical protein